LKLVESFVVFLLAVDIVIFVLCLGFVPVVLLTGSEMHIDSLVPAMVEINEADTISL